MNVYNRGVFLSSVPAKKFVSKNVIILLTTNISVLPVHHPLHAGFQRLPSV